MLAHKSMIRACNALARFKPPLCYVWIQFCLPVHNKLIGFRPCFFSCWASKIQCTEHITHEINIGCDWTASKFHTDDHTVLFVISTCWCAATIATSCSLSSNLPLVCCAYVCYVCMWCCCFVLLFLLNICWCGAVCSLHFTVRVSLFMYVPK